MSSRTAWATRASSRTGSKATKKPCLKKRKKKRPSVPWLPKPAGGTFVHDSHPDHPVPPRAGLTRLTGRGSGLGRLQQRDAVWESVQVETVCERNDGWNVT